MNPFTAMRSPQLSANWITGPRFDLTWYIGACLTGYALIFLNLELGVPALLLWWFWIVSVDGPHVFGTLSRTYLDREEWTRRRPLFLGSLGWFLVGPLAVVAGVAAQTPVPFFVFLTFAQIWAYWHVVRQHYGFLVLYQKKNGEAPGRENLVDYYSFYVLMLAPFASFILRHPAARPQLGLPNEPWPVEATVLLFLHGLIVVTVICYVAKEATRLGRGERLNLPKNLFLLACVPLHLFVFLHPEVSMRVDIMLFAVFVTYYHNIQYHGIVWFYNRNRYRGDAQGERFGWAGRVSRRFVAYYAAGILFTLTYRYANWFAAGIDVPLGSGPNAISGMPLGPFFTLADLAVGFFWGFAFHHYYMDQKIWRLSRDRQLNRDLKLATA